MECDFASACVFDFDNLEFQLCEVKKASNLHQKPDSVLASLAAKRVVYEDLVRFLHTTRNGEGLETFWCKASSPNAQPDSHAPIVSSKEITLIQTTVSMQKALVRELLEEQRAISNSSYQVVETEREREITSLRQTFPEVGEALDWYNNNQAAFHEINNAGNDASSRAEEERAAQFRGRQFPRTTTGLLGLAAPGVNDVEVGDQTVLLDGLTFPLVARAQPDSRLAIVGWY
ncbi:hypothetical protein OQA88_5348 [Cercophora sp. LCS_1]